MDDSDDDWLGSDEDADAGVVGGQVAGHAVQLSAAQLQHARRACGFFQHRGVPHDVVSQLATVLLLDPATRAAFLAWFVAKETARTRAADKARKGVNGILRPLPTPHDAVGTCGLCGKWRIISEAIDVRVKNSRRSPFFSCSEVIGEGFTPLTCDTPSQFATEEAAAQWLHDLLEGRKQAAQLIPGYKPRGTAAYRREQTDAAARRLPARIGLLPGMLKLGEDLKAFFALPVCEEEHEPAAPAGGAAPDGDAEMVDAPAARGSRAARSRARAAAGGGAAGDDSAAATAATMVRAPGAGAAAGAGASQRGASGGHRQKKKRVRKLWEQSDAVGVTRMGEQLGLFSEHVNGRTVLDAMKAAGTLRGDVTPARATTLLNNHCTVVRCGRAAPTLCRRGTPDARLRASPLQRGAAAARNSGHVFGGFYGAAPPRGVAHASGCWHVPAVRRIQQPLRQPRPGAVARAAMIFAGARARAWRGQQRCSIVKSCKLERNASRCLLLVRLGSSSIGHIVRRVLAPGRPAGNRLGHLGQVGLQCGAHRALTVAKVRRQQLRAKDANHRVAVHRLGSAARRRRNGPFHSLALVDKRKQRFRCILHQRAARLHLQAAAGLAFAARAKWLIEWS